MLIKRIIYLTVLLTCVESFNLINGLVLADTTLSSAIEHYRNFYCSSNRFLSNWNQPNNSVSPSYLEAVKRRINYFREQSLADYKLLDATDSDLTIELDQALNKLTQEAALLMSINERLSHQPDETWKNYSESARKTASSSNLALGVVGPSAIDQFIEDQGAENFAVGHRRWLLNPTSKLIGAGFVDGFDNVPASAIWVDYSNIDQMLSIPISWPPRGWVPINLIYERWSFSLHQADFSNTILEIFVDNKKIDFKTEPILDGFGMNTLVWKIDPKIVGTNKVKVILKNIKLPNGLNVNFDYEVWPFNPDQSEDVSNYKIVKSIDSKSGLLPRLHYRLVDQFDCTPAFLKGLVLEWKFGSDYFFLANLGDYGTISLPLGFTYRLRIKNSTTATEDIIVDNLGGIGNYLNNYQVETVKEELNNPNPQPVLPTLTPINESVDLETLVDVDEHNQSLELEFQSNDSESKKRLTLIISSFNFQTDSEKILLVSTTKGGNKIKLRTLKTDPEGITIKHLRWAKVLRSLKLPIRKRANYKFYFTICNQDLTVCSDEESIQR